MTTNKTRTAPAAKAAVTGKAKVATTPTKARFVLIEGEAKILAAIGSIGKASKKLDAMIHQAAVSCLKHIDLHHNITVMSKLVDALPASARKNALKDWALAMGKLGWDEVNDCFTYDKSKPTMLEEAIITPFWKLKPEEKYVPFDLNKKIDAILSSAAAARKKGEALPEDKLALLQAIKAGVPLHADTPLSPVAAADAVAANKAAKQPVLQN